MFNALYWAPPTSTSMHADERGEGSGGRPAQTVKSGPTTLSGFFMNCAILPQKGKARKRALRVMGVVRRWYIHTRE